MSIATQADVLTQHRRDNSQVAVGDLHEVAIEKLVFGGDGLARIGTQAVFVPFAAVGDQLCVRITEVERNYARGVIEEIISPSPTRRAAPCPHFGVCGGCQLLHLDYSAQLAAKASFVRESLRRIGGIEWDPEIEVRHADEFGYRSRAEIKVAHDAEGQPRIGY